MLICCHGPDLERAVMWRPWTLISSLQQQCGNRDPHCPWELVATYWRGVEPWERLWRKKSFSKKIKGFLLQRCKKKVKIMEGDILLVGTALGFNHSYQGRWIQYMVRRTWFALITPPANKDVVLPLDLKSLLFQHSGMKWHLKTAI